MPILARRRFCFSLALVAGLGAQARADDLGPGEPGWEDAGLASVSAVPGNNTALLQQQGDGNAITAAQQGVSQFIDVQQWGDGNQVGVSQQGGDQRAEVSQAGSGNQVVVTQYGYHLGLRIQQVGDFQSVRATQAN